MSADVDQICRRYGKWPHEWLALTPQEQAIALACTREGANRRQRTLGDAKPDMVVVSISAED